MSSLLTFFKQSFILSAPTLTETNLPDQTGRVFIVTGGYAGCGRELASILYQHNSTVYIAGRSPSKADTAIKALQDTHPQSRGKLSFMNIDLADLTTIKPAVDEFLSKESRLDVLTNNAGVMVPAAGSKSTQGHELQIATNCLGPFLLTQLLMPLLQRTAAMETTASGSVRVTWAASLGAELLSPQGGVTLDDKGNYTHHGSDQQKNYGGSKAGNIFLATELARRYPLPSNGKGVVTSAWNPGNLKTELQRSTDAVSLALTSWMLRPAVFGAYTELFAGWSEDAGRPERNGGYVIPWGRFADGYRADVLAETKVGGNAERFWEWCERETREFC